MSDRAVRNAQERARRRADEVFRETERRKIDAHRLKKLYGITIEQYDEMLVAQGGLCAACGNAETSKTPLGGTRKLAVDHDHKTGAVRGLLCLRCNGLLGIIEKLEQLDPTIRSSLEAYLGRALGR